VDHLTQAYNIVDGKSGGKRLLEIPGRKWENTIRMDIRETGYEGVDWIQLAQDRVKWRASVIAVISVRVP
jgi:hypothetical protein